MKSYIFTIYKNWKRTGGGNCLESWKENYEKFKEMGLFGEGCYIDFQEPKLNECECCGSGYD